MDLWSKIVDLVTPYLSPTAVLVLLLVLAAIYIWFQRHRQKLLEERLAFSNEKLTAATQEKNWLLETPSSKSTQGPKESWQSTSDGPVPPNEAIDVRITVSPDQAESIEASGNHVAEILAALREEAVATWNACNNYQGLPNCPTWTAVSSYDWFTDLIESGQAVQIVNYFETVEEYSHLPRVRGTGHRIESWLNTTGLHAKYLAALRELDHRLAGTREP